MILLSILTEFISFIINGKLFFPCLLLYFCNTKSFHCINSTVSYEARLKSCHIFDFSQDIPCKNQKFYLFLLFFNRVGCFSPVFTKLVTLSIFFLIIFQELDQCGYYFSLEQHMVIQL